MICGTTMGDYYLVGHWKTNYSLAVKNKGHWMNCMKMRGILTGNRSRLTYFISNKQNKTVCHIYKNLNLNLREKYSNTFFLIFSDKNSHNSRKIVNEQYCKVEGVLKSI